MKWTPDIIIALVIVVGSMLLLFCGIDTEVKFILGIAAGWAFGTEYQVRKRQGGKS